MRPTQCKLSIVNYPPGRAATAQQQLDLKTLEMILSRVEVFAVREIHLLVESA